MFNQVDSSCRQKMDTCFFHKLKYVSWFLSKHRKALFCKGYIKANRRTSGCSQKRYQWFLKKFFLSEILFACFCVTKKIVKKTVKKTRVNKEHFEVAKFTHKKFKKECFMFLFKIYLQKNSLRYTYYINLVARNMQRKLAHSRQIVIKHLQTKNKKNLHSYLPKAKISKKY